MYYGHLYKKPCILGEITKKGSGYSIEVSHISDNNTYTKSMALSELGIYLDRRVHHYESLGVSSSHYVVVESFRQSVCRLELQNNKVVKRIVEDLSSGVAIRKTN